MSDKLRVEKVEYPDGIGCSIWYPFEDDPDAGVCFDFPFKDIDEIIRHMEWLKTAPARRFVADE